jgi:protein-L-isoaspartate(D-aspartate) O-methyltransferase
MTQNLESARAQMVSQQVRAWHVLSPAVLQVMSEVPREQFVPAAYRSLAFADTAIPLPGNQHMLAPQIEGRVLQALAPSSGERVLEIGTGSGFLTACLARLSGHVLSLEIRPELAKTATQALHQAACRGAEVRVADTFAFSPAEAYDCIAVTGSLPVEDSRFQSWLTPGGRLFIVTGEAPAMTAWLIRRDAGGQFSRESLFETVLDPLDHAPQPERFVF